MTMQPPGPAPAVVLYKRPWVRNPGLAVLAVILVLVGFNYFSVKTYDGSTPPAVTESQKLKDDLATANKRANEAERARDGFKRDLDKAQGELVHRPTADQLRQAQGETTAANAKVTELTGKVTALDAQIKAGAVPTAELDALRTTKTNLEGQLATAKGELATANTRVAEFQTKAFAYDALIAQGRLPAVPAAAPVASALTATPAAPTAQAPAPAAPQGAPQVRYGGIPANWTMTTVNEPAKGEQCVAPRKLVPSKRCTEIPNPRDPKRPGQRCEWDCVGQEDPRYSLR